MNRIIIINKPKAFTSQDVVSKTKKILNVRKAGHIGTLDPLAEGVLPILLGDCTKLSKYLVEHNKTYIATLCLGKKTDTADAEGKVIEEKEVLEKDFNEENIKKVLNIFLGKQMQVPPMYSSVKINGKKLYEYARKGEIIEVPAREIEIFGIKLLNINFETKEIVFEVSCSKGTYIRVLCENIAEKLNTVGYMSALKRTVVGKFNLEEAVTFEELENYKTDDEFIYKHFIKMEELFKNEYKKINLTKRKEELFLNGVMLTFYLEDGIYNIYNAENKYLGLGILKDNLLKRDVILDNHSY